MAKKTATRDNLLPDIIEVMLERTADCKLKIPEAVVIDLGHSLYCSRVGPISLEAFKAMVYKRG